MRLPDELSELQVGCATGRSADRDTLVTIGRDGTIELDQTMAGNYVVLLFLDDRERARVRSVVGRF